MVERTDCTVAFVQTALQYVFLLYWYGARDRSKRCNFEWGTTFFFFGDGMHFYHESINGRKNCGGVF